MFKSITSLLTVCLLLNDAQAIHENMKLKQFLRQNIAVAQGSLETCDANMDRIAEE
jgi:hypothetical protein